MFHKETHYSSSLLTGTGTERTPPPAGAGPVSPRCSALTYERISRALASPTRSSAEMAASTSALPMPLGPEAPATAAAEAP